MSRKSCKFIPALTLCRYGFIGALMLAALPLSAQAQASRLCINTVPWQANIGPTSACGCTPGEAESIAKAMAKATCAAQRPGGAPCGASTCSEGTNACEAEVTNPAIGAVAAVAQPAPDCPVNCPGGTAWRAQVPAQVLGCACKCVTAACAAAHWSVRREISICTNGTERDIRDSARAGFLLECGQAGDAANCGRRLCGTRPAPTCAPHAVTGGLDAGRLVADQICAQLDHTRPYRLTVRGSVGCTCKC